MAGKVNTKFVLFLSLAVVLLVGGVAAFYLTVVRKSTDELEALGDRHLIKAQAVEVDPLADEDERAAAVSQRTVDFKLAAESYGRAWQRDPSNVDILLKYIDAYGQMPVKDDFEARKVLQQIYNLTRTASEQRADDEQLLQDFYEMLHRWGQDLGAASFYSDIYQFTETRLETDPDNLTALKWNGISQAMQLSDDMARTVQQEIRQTLERVHEARPQDTDVMHYLARWHLYDAGRSARVDPGAPDIQPSRDRAAELSRMALEQSPDDPQVKTEFLTLMLALADTYRGQALQLQQRNPQAAEQMTQRRQQIMGEARTVLESLEQSLLEDPNPPFYVQRVTEMLPRVFREEVDAGTNRTEGLQRAERLLETATQKRPDILLFKLMLANLNKLQLDLDEALEQYRAARDHRVMGDFKTSLSDEALRQQAVYEVANIELIRAEASDDPAVREQILADADQAVDELEKVVDTDARVLMLRGKIALLRGQNTRAMQALDEATDMIELAPGQGIGNNNLVEAYLLSARARQAERQWGAAADRLEQVLAIVGNSPRQDIRGNIRLQLAEMLLRGRRFDAAREQINLSLAERPGNITALRLLARYHADIGEPERAIEILEDTGLAETNAAVARTLAGYYAAADRSDEGVALLQQQFEANPGDIALVQTLLRQLDDDDAKLRVLDRAEAAGVSGTAVSLLRSQVTGEGQTRLTLDQMVAATREQEASPFDTAIRELRLYLQFGEMDKAQQALQQAKQLQPDDDQVLLLEIDLAVSRGEFETARRLVGEAGRRNLDLADGHFLRGRLAAAEGKSRQAIVAYEQGLRRRPIFDDGWRQFGDLLLAAGDADAALNAYSTAVDQRPDNTQAIVGLANANQQMGRRQQALDTLRTAVRYAPGNRGLVERYLALESQIGSEEIALRQRQELAESQPDNLQNRIALALLTARQGDYQEAEAMLEQMIEQQGPNRVLIGTQATVLRLADDTDAGERVIQQYLDGLGDEATALDLVLLARYQLAAQRPQDSVETYRRAAAMEQGPERAVDREFADVLFNAGQIESSVELYRSLFEHFKDQPGEQTVGLRLAEALLRIDQPQQAEQVLNQLDQDTTANALRAQLARQRGNVEQAMEFVNAALEQDRTNAMSYLQRASLLAEDPATLREALADAEQALSIDPNLLQALGLQASIQLALDQPEAAARSLRNVLDQAPGNNAVRFQLANLYLQQGDTRAADDLVDTALEREPENGQWLLLSARLAASQDDNRRAIERLETLMDLQPSVPALAQLSLLYLEEGRPDATDALLNEHPTLLNQSPPLQAVWARALADAGQSDSARRLFALALQRAASLTQFNEILGQMITSLGRDAALQLAEDTDGLQDPTWLPFAAAQSAIAERDYAAAEQRLSVLRETVTEPAARVRVEQMQALVMLQTEDFRGAKEAYQRLLDADPDNLEVLNNLAYIMANNLDDPAGAVPLAERARDLAPRNAEVLDTLGWTYYQADRLRDAQRTLEESVDAAPLPANTYHLGRVYFELDDPQRARDLLEQSVQLAQSDPGNAYSEAADDLLRKIR